MNNNRPPASIWQPICDGKQGNYYYWPKRHYILERVRVLADSIEKSSRQSSEDMFHDEIVPEIKEQLGPSYNSLSL